MAAADKNPTFFVLFNVTKGSLVELNFCFPNFVAN
jgi:hypothetical protein